MPPQPAFVPSRGQLWRPRAAGARTGSAAASTCMAKSAKRSAGRQPRRARAPEPAAGGAPAAPAAPAGVGGAAAADAADAADTEAADRELLRLDVAAFKAQNQPAEGEAPLASRAYGVAKTVVDNVLLADFFLIIALLVWLVVALVPHFAAKDDSLLDPWLALWQPFIQPVLGVLMLATIGQGMITYMFSSED